MFNALCCFAVKLKPLKTMKFIKKQRKRTKPSGGGVSTSSRSLTGLTPEGKPSPLRNLYQLCFSLALPSHANKFRCFKLPEQLAHRPLGGSVRVPQTLSLLPQYQRGLWRRAVVV